MPLEWKNLPDEGLPDLNLISKYQLDDMLVNNMYSTCSVASCSKDRTDEYGLKDQQRWSVARCGEVFAEALSSLKKSLEALQAKSPGDHLVWDKDDQSAMDFVASCANIRAHIFGIPQKTRFDIKCKLLLETNNRVF